MQVSQTKLLLTIATLAAAAPSRADVSFVRNIAPIVLKRCTGCHGERANLGGYRAQTFQNMMRVGASGRTPVVAGKPGESRLFQLLTAKSDAVRMPRSDDPLSAVQIETFRKWIQEGAKFDGADASLPLRKLIGPRLHPAAPISYRAAIPIMALTFVPGGREVAVDGYNEVTFWDATTGALRRRIGHLPQRIQALAYSPDGARLLIAGGTPGDYGEVDLIDPATATRTAILDTFNDIVLSAAFSSDGKSVVAGCADGSVCAYGVASGKRIWAKKVHSDWVTSVSFSFDGKFVASASKDMTVKVYEAQSGELYTTYTGHNRQIGQYRGAGAVYAVQFAPGSLLACSAGAGKWIQLWDPIKAKSEAGDAGDMEERFAKQGHARYIAHGFAQDVYALVVRDGLVFAASADGAVKEFDLTTLKELRSFSGLSDWAFALDYDASTHRLAAGSYKGDVRIWDSRTGQILTSFKAQPSYQNGAH